MKKHVAALAIITILIALPIAAAKKKAYVDYDRSFDFSTIKTFAYIDTLETSVADDAPPVHEMIKLLVIKGFQQGGMKQVGEDEDPDIMVTYHTDPQQEMKMNVTLYSYSYSAGWYWSPLWGSGMDVSSYTRGTLIIDAWVPETNTLIWRGTVIGVVPDDPSPKKARKIIEEALQKIGKEWRKQKNNAGS
jgi:hypothetical protein